MEVLYMKKLLTALFLSSALGFGTLSAGQVYFEDNFENGLSKWTTVDVDQFNLAQEAYETMGLTATKKISWDAVKSSATNTVALSSSYYNPAGAADDWLISQEFEIGEGAILEWSASAYGAPSYPDGYEVYIATSGTGQVSDFTTKLYTNPGENKNMTIRTADLANYKNQKIRIAFRNNSNDKFFLFLDDVKVHVPNAIDLAIVAVDIPTYVKKGTTQLNFPIYLQNKCYNTTITSFDLTYQVEGEEPVTSTFNSPVIGAYYSYSLFTHPIQWDPATLGQKKITFTLSNINGTNEPDAVPEDNTVEGTTLVWDNTIAADLFPLYESFTSSTCAPCASVGKILNPILDATADKMSLIKYQMNWPGAGDPYYNADGELRKTYYAVNSVPMAFTNGTKYEFTNTNLTQAGLNSAVMNQPALYSINTPTYTITDRTVTVNAEIEAVANLTGSTITAHVSVFEFKTTGNVASNGETEFHHVTQKMLPNGNGTAVTALAAGSKQTLALSYDFPATAKVEEMDDLGVVIFVQDNTGKSILQSAYAVKQTNSVPYVEDGNGVVGLYPNPAKESAQLKYSINGDKQVNIELFDLSGNSVYTADRGVLSTGYYNENFNLTSLANGQYFVRLNIGGRMFTDVITISK